MKLQTIANLDRIIKKMKTERNKWRKKQIKLSESNKPQYEKLSKSLSLDWKYKIKC